MLTSGKLNQHLCTKSLQTAIVKLAVRDNEPISNFQAQKVILNQRQTQQASDVLARQGIEFGVIHRSQWGPDPNTKTKMGRATRTSRASDTGQASDRPGSGPGHWSGLGHGHGLASAKVLAVVMSLASVTGWAFPHCKHSGRHGVVGRTKALARC